MNDLKEAYEKAFIEYERESVGCILGSAREQRKIRVSCLAKEKI